MNKWEDICIEDRGVILTGFASHCCADWDGLAIDETCIEYPCACCPLPWVRWWQRPMVAFRSRHVHRQFNREAVRVQQREDLVTADALVNTWRAVTMGSPPAGHGVLVALVRDSVVYRVALAERTALGFYELYSGTAAHWATHWAQNLELAATAKDETP